MPYKASASALLAAGAVFCVMTGLPLPSELSGTADAKAFFTKKRVKGRWISGQFAKGETKSSRGSRRLAARASRRSASPAVIEPDETEIPVPPARPALGSRIISTASIAPAPEPQQTQVADRMRPGLIALAARMSGDGSLPAPTAASVPAERSPAATSPDTTLSSLTPAQSPAASSPPSLALRSVTFDFARNVKTVVFNDGVAMSEPFDPSRVRDVTTLAPAKP